MLLQLGSGVHWCGPAFEMFTWNSKKIRSSARLIYAQLVLVVITVSDKLTYVF